MTDEVLALALALRAEALALALALALPVEALLTSLGLVTVHLGAYLDEERHVLPVRNTPTETTRTSKYAVFGALYRPIAY